MTGGAGVTVSPAPYLPFHDPHKGRAPGLFALDPANWVERDAAYCAQMALRDRLLAAEPERYACLRPAATAALGELLSLLAAHLVTVGYRRDGADLIRPDGVRLRLAPDPVVLGRLCQEDWLILLPPEGAGEFTLEAGALVFPAGWSIGDKMGLPLTAIHDPVPEYAEALASRVNRIFAAAHPERPLQRFNFSIGNATLSADRPRANHDATSSPHLRVERQTLRCLPESRAVVFGVKTYLTPLADLRPEDRARLAEVYAGFSPDMARYRNAEVFSGAVLRNG